MSTNLEFPVKIKISNNTTEVRTVAIYSLFIAYAIIAFYWLKAKVCFLLFVY